MWTKLYFINKFNERYLQVTVAMGGYEEHLRFMLFFDNYVQKRENSFF